MSKAEIYGMKINPRPQLSSSTTAVRHPEQHPCTQNISSTITGSHNKTFKEVSCLFQGFLIFASGNFIIGEARNEIRNVLYSTHRLICFLGRIISHQCNGFSIYSAFKHKRASSGWPQRYTFGGTCSGFSPSHLFSWCTQDIVHSSAQSLRSPVWMCKTSVTHRFFLLGKFRCQDSFCSLPGGVSELQRPSQKIVNRPRRKLLFILHMLPLTSIFLHILHISSLPLTLSCQSSAPITISYFSEWFWYLILIFLLQSLSRLCRGLRAAIHLCHYKIYTRLWKQALSV